MTAQIAIRKAIEAAGSQTGLAGLIGRSQNWVSRVASGRIASISVDDAFAIEQATGGAVKAAEFAGIAPAPEAGGEPGEGGRAA